MHLAMAYELAKRDAVKIHVSRFVDWILRQAFRVEDARAEGDRLYRQGWNDAMAHARRHLLGS